jgi:hypothetical protein
MQVCRTFEESKTWKLLEARFIAFYWVKAMYVAVYVIGDRIRLAENPVNITLQ